MAIFLIIILVLYVGFSAWALAMDYVSLVEIIIIGVIISLLLAMAIPAFQKVKETAISRAIQAGEKVSAEDREWYRERKKSTAFVSPKVTQSVEAPVAIHSVTLDGKTFYLIPKTEAQETVINGKTYWLIPQ